MLYLINRGTNRMGRNLALGFYVNNADILEMLYRDKDGVPTHFLGKLSDAKPHRIEQCSFHIARSIHHPLPPVHPSKQADRVERRARRIMRMSECIPEANSYHTPGHYQFRGRGYQRD